MFSFDGKILSLKSNVSQLQWVTPHIKTLKTVYVSKDMDGGSYVLCKIVGF